MLKAARFIGTSPDGAESQPELSNLECAKVRLLGEVRLALSITAILLFFQPPAEAGLVVFAIAGSYAAFSVVLLRKAVGRTMDVNFRIAPWVDAIVYGSIVALTGLLESRFAVFLLFPAVALSFERGMRPGMGLAIICMLWLVAITLIQGLLQPSLLVNHVSLAAMMAIVVVALVITRWALFEVSTMRRLAFSHDLNQVFTPRQGLDHALYELAKMLLSYHDADACVIVMRDTASAERWLLYEVDVASGRKSTRGEPLDAALAEALLAIPQDHAVLFGMPRFPWQRRVCETVSVTDLTPRDSDVAQLEELANLLETCSFLSLPVRSRNQTIGRLYVSLQRVRYPVSHLRFLEQIMSQAGLMIENMQLVERLTLQVANEERRKISRDLHDGTIQPYVGLKLGLEALRRKAVGDAHIARELEELIKIAGDGINQLRHYVGHLKGMGVAKANESLLPAMRGQAAKFSEYYGIRTTVVADADITVNARLFEEVMFIVCEGLSNIRRHSESQHARLSLHAGDHCLMLEFINDNGCGEKAPSDVFFPRTIGERARELGGQVHVQHRPGGETAVTVEIPV